MKQLFFPTNVTRHSGAVQKCHLRLPLSLFPPHAASHSFTKQEHLNRLLDSQGPQIAGVYRQELTVSKLAKQGGDSWEGREGTALKVFYLHGEQQAGRA